jgi:uncharacterized protein
MNFIFKVSILTGCIFAFTLQATSLKSEQLRSNLSSENFQTTLATLSADTSDNDELWYWLDLARLQQADENFTTSIQSFEKAFTILDEFENRAKVSIRNIGSFIGSALLSKGAETYYGKGYERSLMHTINALNYTMLGNFEGAAVEMRRMEQRQEFWLKESEEKIKDAADETKKAQQQGNDTSAIPDGYSMASMLENPEVRSVANSYQDPFSYALSKIIFDFSGQSETGEISFKRALALNPDVANAFIKSPITPSLEQITQPNKSKSKKNKPQAIQLQLPKPLQKMEVTLIVLSGLAPSLKIEKIKFPLYNGANYSSIDLSSYTPPLNDISILTVSTPSLRVQPPRLLKSDVMAYKTLKDELPGELAKSVVRATIKAVAAKQVSDQFGAFGGLIASLAMDIGSSIADSGFRNWDTLPNSGYLTKFTTTKGDTITIALNEYQQSLTLPLDKTGIIILVSYLTSNNIRISHVSY